MPQTSDIEFLEYIDSSANRLAELSGENHQLRTKVAELSEEKVILQKVASAKVFDDSEIDEVLEKLGASRLIDPLQVSQVGDIIKEDHKKVLSLMVKLAETATTYSAGEGISREPDPTSSDPDGWGELINKRI